MQISRLCFCEKGLWNVNVYCHWNWFNSRTQKYFFNSGNIANKLWSFKKQQNASEKGGRSFFESVQMTKHETITWRRWWSCSPWTSWPPSPQRRPGLEQAEMKIYWGLKSFWPNRCLLLGKPSCKKKCFLSGIARITSPPPPPPPNSGNLYHFFWTSKTTF